MKNTVNYEIIKYLDSQVDLFNSKPKFVFAGVISRAVHDLTKCKESIIERRCRELAREGKLEADYQQVNGKGPHVVLYRVKIPDRPEDLRKYYESVGRIKVEIITMPDGTRKAVEKII